MRSGGFYQSALTPTIKIIIKDTVLYSNVPLTLVCFFNLAPRSVAWFNPFLNFPPEVNLAGPVFPTSGNIFPTFSGRRVPLCERAWFWGCDTFRALVMKCGHGGET